jgi:hypothetical protein
MDPVVGSLGHNNRPGLKKENVVEILNQLCRRYLLKESTSRSSLCFNYKGTCHIVATIKLDDLWVQNVMFGA